MSEAPVRPIVKWPFLAGDLLLVLLSFYVVSSAPAAGGSIAHLALGTAALLAGCVLAVIPFIIEYRAAGRISEAVSLEKVLGELKQLETFAAQVGSATANWQSVQEQCNKTVGAAGDITKKMSAEVQAFGQFIQRVNDTEKNHMRLELEKLKRAEGDWVQVLVRVMDHIYALHQGGVRSGQRPLIEQLSHFQSACREAARRVGLSAFAGDGEVFDSTRHQPVEGDAKDVVAGTKVAQTIATGYTLQGRLLRPALVRLESGQTQIPPTESVDSQQSATADPEQSEGGPEVMTSEPPAAAPEEAEAEETFTEKGSAAAGAEGQEAQQLDREEAPETPKKATEEAAATGKPVAPAPRKPTGPAQEQLNF